MQGLSWTWSCWTWAVPGAPLRFVAALAAVVPAQGDGTVATLRFTPRAVCLPPSVCLIGLHLFCLKSFLSLEQHWTWSCWTWAVPGAPLRFVAALAAVVS